MGGAARAAASVTRYRSLATVARIRAVALILLIAAAVILLSRVPAPRGDRQRRPAQSPAAAAEGKHFSVVVRLQPWTRPLQLRLHPYIRRIKVTEGRPDSTGPHTAKLLTDAGVPVRQCAD